MKKKIIFFSFATKDLSISADRLRIQTSNTEFYDDIKEKLTQIDVDILNVEHNQYHEKYHFKKGNEVAVFLFYYDGKKRFKKVIPEITPTSSKNLINEIGKLL